MSVKDDYKIFSAFALFWIFLGWLGFLLALSGLFYSWIFIGYFILGIIGAIYFLHTSVLPFNLIRLNGKDLPFGDTRRSVLEKKSTRCFSEFFCVALALLAITILFSLFTVPTIFSGRDQGSISEAGIRLAQNHQLEFSTAASQEFFKIYGPGKALNFPGFHYTKNGELITQFPIPYIAWLGIFYSIFGLAGLIIANAVLFYLFLFSSYLLFRLFSPIKYSVVFLLLLLTSFSFSWFLKFTLSENMALALVWLGILQLTLFFKELSHSIVIPEFSERQQRKYPESTRETRESVDSRFHGNDIMKYIFYQIPRFCFKEKSSLYFYSLLAIFGLMVFTRIEGIALLVMLIILISLNKDAREFISAEKIKRFFLPVLFFIAVFVLDLIINFNFFKEIAKAVSKDSAGNFETESLLSASNIFLIYGMAPYIIFGLMGIIYFIKKRARLELLPFILIVPLFFYLINPHISPDHPWMLRRYIFALLPIFIFYTALWLACYFKRNKFFLSWVLIAVFLLLNFPAFFKYFAFSENENLSEQTKNLSQNFSNDDLVLIDRLASGDGWSMLSGPMNFLYGKNAVYFFNLDDLNKLNLEKFDKIYLIVPDERSDFYKDDGLKDRLVFYKNYQLETSRLEVFKESARNVALPKKKIVKIEGKIFEIGK